MIRKQIVSLATETLKLKRILKNTKSKEKRAFFKETSILNNYLRIQIVYVL